MTELKANVAVLWLVNSKNEPMFDQSQHIIKQQGRKVIYAVCYVSCDNVHSGNRSLSLRLCTQVLCTEGACGKIWKYGLWSQELLTNDYYLLACFGMTLKSIHGMHDNPVIKNLTSTNWCLWNGAIMIACTLFIYDTQKYTRYAWQSGN